jgi:hypothetical protein
VLIVDGGAGVSTAVETVVSLLILSVSDFSLLPLQEDKKNNTTGKTDMRRNRDDVIVFDFKFLKNMRGVELSGGMKK